jgi:beta-lactamase class A
MTAGMPAGSVSIAALDSVTGARYDYGATADMTMGSVAKLLVLEACLLQQQDERRAAAEWELEDLAAMMVNSDNDAADELYAALGGDPGMTTAIQRLGLTSTTVQAADHWGLGTTSATDQLRLLQQLVGTGSSLLAPSQDFALGLMRAVEDDQRWGVGAVADPGSSFANKNGWLGLDDDDGRWLVNSVGVLSVRGHQVLMVVLTQHDEDVAEGIDLTESLAATAVTGLGLD